MADEAWRYRTLTMAALAASACFTGAALALLVAIDGRPRAGLWESTDQVVLWDSMMLAAGIIAVLLARRQPHNRLGRWLAAGSVIGTLATAADEYAALALDASPGLLPGGTIAWHTSNAALFASWALLGSHVALRFPNGELLTARWRQVGRLATASAVLCALAAFNPNAFEDKPRFNGAPALTNPIGIPGLGTPIEVAFGAGLLALFAATFLGVASLVVRSRRATGVERVQVRWVAFGAVTVTVLTVALANLANVTEDPIRGGLLAVGSVTPSLLMVTLGIAVIRHNLFDLNLVIQRAVLSTLVATFITVTYVAVAVAGGAILGGRSDSELPVAIIATAAVALAFEPARRRFDALANRLVYGDVVAPYEVMSDLSRRMTNPLSPEAALAEVAHAVGRGLRASAARVRLILADGTRESTWLADPWSPPDTYALVRDVTHAGDKVGEIDIAVRSDDPPRRADLRVLDDLVSHAGVTLDNLRLTAQLEQRLEELRASRQRLVEAQNEERRRMERDIHDGAQQHLVALQIKLGLARHVVEKNPEHIESTFAELQVDAREALQTLRDLARGVFPPTLTEQGIASALQSHAAKMMLPVEVDASALGEKRFQSSTEAAVYFCIREALQNATKHAPGSPLAVTLGCVEGKLVFSVRDSGPGFDPATVRRGSGLQNMVDRIEALDGSLTFVSAVGEGTTVTGWVPAVPVAAMPVPTPH